MADHPVPHSPQSIYFVQKFQKCPPDNTSDLDLRRDTTAGRLPRSNGIPWRGDSGLKDGSDAADVKGGLVGGYYDAGDNIKFHFPMAFSMTLLSWSVIEYSAKYKAVGEYDHVRELIKWGTDYLLLTFNSSASTIDKIYAQVTETYWSKFSNAEFLSSDIFILFRNYAPL